MQKESIFAVKANSIHNIFPQGRKLYSHDYTHAIWHAKLFLPWSLISWVTFQYYPSVMDTKRMANQPS